MSQAVADSAIKEVSTQVLRYFREFVSTDFKRIQAPRRRIQLKTQDGFRCAIDLRKYPTLFKDAWALLSKPPQEMTLRFSRRAYRAQISPVLRNLIDQFVKQLPAKGLEDVRASVLREAQAKRQAGAANVETYVEDIVAHFQESTTKEVVMPLLALLEGPFKENAYSAEDSIFEVQAELTEMLCAGAATHLPEALNTLMLTGDEAAIAKLLEEFFAIDLVREKVVEFFEVFAAADAFQELRDVLNYAGSDDTLTTYLYFGAIKFGPNDYPLFYLPISVRSEGDGAGYLLNLDPRLYVNKQAIEYIATEMRQQSERVSVAVIPERIIHLDDNDTAQARIEQVMKTLQRTFDVAADVDFRDHKVQNARSPQLRLSNAAYLSVFDRNDESLVNDYEALLSSLDADHREAGAMFEGIVKSMLFEDPPSVSGAVRDEWNGMTPAQRLVTNSPIPLNEEQIRIDNARRKPGCRFLSVEGPPGTGKSHTITALAFNAIMDRQSVLIISDKNEALDVVQDKLTEALLAVRTGEDFPNPILRLGKDGTYRSLISGAARVRIQNHHAAQTSNMPALERELESRSAELAGRIEKAVQVLGNVELARVARLHLLEAQLGAIDGDLCQRLEKLAQDNSLHKLNELLAAWTEDQRQEALKSLGDRASLVELLQAVRMHALVEAVATQLDASDRAAMGLFEPMPASNVAPLLDFVARIEALRWPVIGYLFKGGALAALDAEITKQMPSPDPVGLSRKVPQLKLIASALGKLRSAAQSLDLPDDVTSGAYGHVQRGQAHMPQARAALAVLQEAIRLIVQDLEAEAAIESALRSELGGVLLQAIEFMTLSGHLRQHFSQVPQIDFVADKARLESLNTARLAHRLDSRFLKFVENNRATAQALGGVIKQRAQFPVDQFKTLRDAFPCVIAGIRELGEFVPLKTGVFDLLIIDEGSQVSVAQAMPAMLRAKQVVIFGDRKQFSNVKSHNASNVTNASYLTALQDHFRTKVSAAVDKIDRLQRFDVKRSVLDFVALVANHQEMLRKHFRGYPELISYSSKMFYDGALQAIKVRPVPIEDVIQFEVIDHDGRAEHKRNTNVPEAEHILRMLEKMPDLPKPPTVAIITPHTEQVALLSAMLSRHALGDVFESRLRLKVFSFDTCQGEERDIIIYSMVATRERDVLNYIFPVQLGVNEDENDNLKAQRLNVGFSRAKERMVFVLSKQPEEFKGTIGQALMHFRRFLVERNIAEAADTDPNSPMEKRLLEWLTATPFFQQEHSRLELIAQFPVGDYLRQLDPTYKHPAYKVDFLLRHTGGAGGEIANVIIEYDGYREHFVNRDKVTAANYERHYKPEDIERQFVLESYGYRFLRVNRFNIGSDPVATLDGRLREMIDLAGADDDEGAEAVERIKAQAQALDNKEAKRCSKCQTVKDLKDFFDPSLGGGSGGHGRVCMECKMPKGRGSLPHHGFQPAYRQDGRLN